MSTTDDAGGESRGHQHEIVEEIPAYQGVRYGMHLVRERLPDGRIAERDVVRHPGAAVIVPVLDDGRILLVEQYRTPIDALLLEVPAGLLDPGEDPITAAARELEEETGHRARKIEPIIAIHPTPGFCDEVMHCFVATGLEPTQQNLDEHEIIEVHPHTIAEIRQLLRDGAITDAKTVASLLHLFAFHDGPWADGGGE